MRLAEGWLLDEDARGPLLRAPRGCLRIDGELVDILAGRRERTSRPLEICLGEVLARLGALADETRGEPERPAAPTSGPVVSIVIPTLGRHELLAGCLRSVAQQTYAGLEVLVVNGGAGEDVRAASAARVLNVPAGAGFARACNDGIAAAGGELIVILNDDAELELDAVAQLVRVWAGARDALGAVCAMARRSDLRAVVDSLGNVAGAWGFGSGRYAGFVDMGQFEDGEELFSAAFTCVLVPRTALESVGPLDERYGFYYEDLDWSLRARMGGLRILAAPHAIAYHQGSASIGDRASGFKLGLVTRNRMLWAGKLLPPRNALGFARHYAVDDVRRGAAALREGRRVEAVAVARAWAGAAAQLPSLARSRRELARRDAVADVRLFDAAAAPDPLTDGPDVRLDGPALRAHYMHVEPVVRRLRGLRA
jgi:GT2 family glycosyltransferase